MSRKQQYIDSTELNATEIIFRLFSDLWLLSKKNNPAVMKWFSVLTFSANSEKERDLERAQQHFSVI